MKTRFLSRFTPSLMPPEALEAIFVQREQLSQEIIERIRNSALTRSGQHTLLIGPRGIGKTHFVSLIYYRIQAVKELSDRLLIAWLREEEWGVTSFRDFLLRILRTLPSQIPEDTSLEKRIESMHLLPMDQAELAAAEALIELVGKRCLLMLVENLDDLFLRLGTEGQRQLSEFIQRNPFFCIVATSPSSFSDLLRPGAPFSGFFNIHQLEELTFEDTARLMVKIAKYEGNLSLANFVMTPKGRARMRALRYLAGGNHRAYVIFSQLLMRDSLDELLEPLLRTIDDLTPYYQSRIAALSPAHRKIIEYICEKRHPVLPTEIARACFLTSASVSAQLDNLTRIGYLHALSVGREKYYELREPLMRLTIEVKKHRGKPIRLLLDFLRLWYSPAELKERLSVLALDAGMEREYALPTLQTSEKDWEDPRIPECCEEYSDCVAVGDYAGALQAAEELVTIRGQMQDLSAQASCLMRLGRYGDAVEIYDRIVTQTPDNAVIWHLRGSALFRVGRLEEALVSCDKSLELDELVVRTWCDKGSILMGLGRREEALASCDNALLLNAEDPLAWTTRGKIFADMGTYEEASAAFEKVVKMEPQNALARDYLCAALVELKRFEEALEHAQQATELTPDDPVAWVLQGTAFAGLNRSAEALNAFDRALDLGEESSLVYFKRAELLLALNRWRAGAASLDEALGRFARSDRSDAGNTAALIRNLNSNLHDPKVLRLNIKVLVLLYRKHKVLSALGHGLIERIPDLISPKVFDDASVHSWCQYWTEIAGKLPEFRLPLRFLEYAVRYRETRDLRVFMELPLEERSMLEPMIGVRVQETA